MSHSKPSEGDLVAQWALVVQGVQASQQQVLADVERIGVPAQFFAVLHLILLAPDERLPMSKLARDLSMTSGGFTKLADRMAREGLIDRRGSAGDRRVIYAALTDRGRELAKAGVQVYAEAVRKRVLDVITTSDLNVIADIAGTLHNARDNEVPPQAAEFKTQDRDPASPERRGRVPRTTTTADQAPRP